MTSAINTSYPTAINPTTASVRDNFSAAKNEIEALQLVDVGIKSCGLVTMSMPGNYVATTGTLRKYFLANASFTQIRVTTTTTTSASSIVLKKNGTTIKTINLANGITDSSIQSLTLSVTTSEYLTVDITGTGTDLVVTIS